MGLVHVTIVPQATIMIDAAHQTGTISDGSSAAAVLRALGDTGEGTTAESAQASARTAAKQARG